MNALEWTYRVMEIRRCPHDVSEEEITRLGGDPQKNDPESILELTDKFFSVLYSPQEGTVEARISSFVTGKDCTY
jgi:hypothetical protein